MESKEFKLLATRESHENTQPSDSRLEKQRDRRAGRIRRDDGLVRYGRSSREGTSRNHCRLDNRSRGDGSPGKSKEVMDLSNIRKMRLWRGLEHGRYERSIVHSGHVELAWHIHTTDHVSAVVRGCMNHWNLPLISCSATQRDILYGDLDIKPAQCSKAVSYNTNSIWATDKSRQSILDRHMDFQVRQFTK